MCSDTSSSQGLISRGRRGRMGVLACLHFVPISVLHQKEKKNNPQSLLCFPPRCKLDARWGKTDADPSLTPKEEVADKQALPWETTENPQPTHGSAQATPCAFRSIISIHRPPVYYTNMFFTCTDARRFRCFNMFTRSERLKGRPFYSVSSGMALEVMAFSFFFTFHPTSRMVGRSRTWYIGLEHQLRACSWVAVSIGQVRWKVRRWQEEQTVWGTELVRHSTRGFWQGAALFNKLFESFSIDFPPNLINLAIFSFFVKSLFRLFNCIRSILVFDYRPHNAASKSLIKISHRSVALTLASLH